MTPSEQTSLYNEKANDSFKTKMDLFIYSLVIRNKIISDDEFIDSFGKFEIEKYLVDEFATKYFKMDRKAKLQGKIIDNIYDEMKKVRSKHEAISQCRRYYTEVEFKKIFPKEELIDMVVHSNECYYCKVTKEEIDQLTKEGKVRTKRERGFKFEIDRLNPNKEYTKENCRMCCYWCNNAKTDEFTADEFMEIAKGISQIWKDRLANDYVFEANY